MAEGKSEFVQSELVAQKAPEVTPEEMRWRMEKVVQFAAAAGYAIDDAATQFNKALAILDGQDNASGDTNQPS